MVTLVHRKHINRRLAYLQHNHKLFFLKLQTLAHLVFQCPLQLIFPNKIYLPVAITQHLFVFKFIVLAVEGLAEHWNSKLCIF